jgi:hypothetical protein
MSETSDSKKKIFSEKKRVVYSCDFINKFAHIMSLPSQLIHHLKTVSSTHIDPNQVPQNLKRILNQLTADNIYQKINEIILNVSTVAHFQKLSELIFSMVILDDKFSALYAKLCRILQRFTVKDDCHHEITFVHVLLENFSVYFGKCLDQIEKISLTKEEDEHEWFKRKTFIKFVGELHNSAILTRFNIGVCLSSLYDIKCPNKIFLMCKLIKCLNPMKIKKNEEIIRVIQKITQENLSFYPPVILFHVNELKEKLNPVTPST